MPTLTVHQIETPDGDILVRCDQYPAWLPKPVAVVDRAGMEKQLRAHQTRATRFQWFTVPSPVLEHLGFDRD